MRPRTAFALGLAGLATAGLGGSVLPADAEVRTFELTLVDGKVVTVSVDVPPGTELWDIKFPGVLTDQIQSIAELPTPAPVTTTPANPSTTPSTTTAPPPGQTTATTPAPAPAPGQPAEPKVAAEPEVKDGGSKQKTTGKKQRKDEQEAEEAAEDAAPQRERDRSRRPGEGGLPTLDNPTTSIAIPGAAPIGVPNFFIDKFRIPPFLLSIYQAAGMEYGIRWEVLAAINEIETDYGRNLNVSSAGALGWMQFMPATWKQYGTDANGDKKKDPYNPVDAIFSAARYLRAAGAEEDLRKAIFAYNHADWYVDSVLMRARLIGGLPSNLVGSLTGLTQGMFPVGRKSRYADDLDEAEAKKRVAKGRNAALPVESDADRRGIDIYSRPGAPVVAVQDGKIVKIGQNARLGKFIQLRDAYGNTYTYAQLKKLAKRHPVPKESRRDVEALAVPPKDPAPTAAASAGSQDKPAPRSSNDAASKASVGGSALTKQRLYASPSRPEAFKAGGREQLEGKATASDLKLLGLPSDQVEMKKLKVGSRVIGGTILGRIGRTSMRQAPHMRFEIRPAGRGAPRIDPKPILDGWKLLESTAVYRAEGRNPFFGPDATPSIGQILLMSKTDLEHRVLKNPRIEIYGGGRRDVRTSRIDRRVLATLEFLAASGLRPTVTSLDSGHSTYTKGGNVSHHASGNAVDIAKINGIPIMGHQGKGSITDVAVQRLLTLQGTLKPAQIITLMDYDGADNTLAMGDHDDHIHVGFTPYLDTNSKAGRQLGAVLKPGQWIKLIDRLGEIDNPTVRVKPSKDALTVKTTKRASRRHRGE
jgi:murein DD-endopeptidase MepM/ murein hydrolase activator NlpD